ncbi:MAG: MoaD/ThiS family protein [Bacillota bacterium]
MRVEICFCGPFAERAGRDRLVVDLADGATISDLIKSIGERVEPAFNEAFLERLGSGGALLRLLLHNGRHVCRPSGLLTRLSHGDRITLVPPMEGG